MCSGRLTKYLEHSPYNPSRFASFSFYVCVQGAVKLLGRAFAEPEFKIVEQHYKKPPLRFYDINLGRAAAGELLAAFELIELDYSGFGEVTLLVLVVFKNLWQFWPSFLSVTITLSIAEMGTGDLVKIKPGKSLLFLSLGAFIHSENFSGCFYVDDTPLFFSFPPSRL